VVTPTNPDPAAAELYARVVKRLGRNARPDGPGVLDPDDAAQAWTALLEQRFSRPQEAALLMGLRIHGESPPMLAAFVGATRPHCATIRGPAEAATVVLYATGTARREPPLAPLLAKWLARRGTPVLLVTHDAGQGANAGAVLQAMGEAPCLDAEGAARRLADETGRLAWMPIEAVMPKVARLLARRAELGFRNSAHSLVKLLVPIDGRAVIVANYTHEPYRVALGAAAELLGLSMCLVRGTEGDPVAWESERHAPRAWLRGEPFSVHELELVGAANAGRPAAAAGTGLPRPDDVAETANFCRAVLGGATDVPGAIERQARLLERLARFEVRPALDATDEVPGGIDYRQPEAAAAWESGAPWEHPWRDEFFSRFAHEIGGLPQYVTRILELGSGPGFLAHWLLGSFPHVKYTMLDYSAPMHELAVARLGDLANRAQCVERDFKRPGWSEGLGRFECVATMQAVHELRNKRRAAALHAEVRGVLAPRGIYLVCDHVLGSPGRTQRDLYMSVAEQAQSLRDAGFAQVSTVYEKDGLVLHRAQA